MLFTLLKAACLATYALAIAAWAGILPAGFAGNAQTIAVVILCAHVLELVFMFRHVRLYRGPLGVSVLLTLLFGLLHWLPLARAQGKKATA